MLVRFSVSNFLSFNGRTEFGMESGRVTKKTEHLLLDEGAKKSLLKFAAIYGKNGAGKSNLVRALNVLRGFVLSGKLPRRAPSLWCRICDANEARPTDFSVEFIAEGALYEYSVSLVLSTGIITREELVHIAGNRRTKLFYKESAESGCAFHHSVRGQSKDIEVLSRTFAMSGVPFLFSINHNTGGFFKANPQADALQRAYLWFRDTLEVIFPDQPLQETSLLQYDVSIDEFARLLKSFDTGIEEMRLEPVTREKVFESLDPQTRQRLNMDFALAPSLPLLAKAEEERRYASVIRSRRDIFIIAFEEDRDFHFYAVKFVHAIGGRRIEFSMESESDGTHRLFQLLEILVGRKEKVYVMDEMSRSLHPKLTVQFVRKYLADAAGRRVQLITTTHESRLMSHDLVRRDEIWIADLNGDGSTRLFSLEDEQVRIDKVLDQNYMDNVWGGVPVFEGESSVFV